MQLVNFVPDGALSAYSAFLGSLVAVELEGLSRGTVHSAMKQASIPSSNEAGLRAKAEVLRGHHFTKSELANGYSRCRSNLYVYEHVI